MFQSSHLKTVLMVAIAFGLGACTGNSSGGGSATSEASTDSGQQANVYTVGTMIRTFKVSGPLIFRGGDGEVVHKEALQGAFGKEIDQLSAISSVVETKEGYLELYNGNTLAHALRISDGTFAIAYQKDVLSPETIHFMISESDAHHQSSALTFGLKSCQADPAAAEYDDVQGLSSRQSQAQGQSASMAAVPNTIAVGQSCRYATVAIELIGDTNSGQGQSGTGTGSGTGQGQGQSGTGTGTGTGSGTGKDQSQGQSKGQDKGQDTTPSKDQSTSQDKGTGKTKP